MAIIALNSAATGLRALSTRIDVIANNLANAETTAFKRSDVNFEDLMYQALKQPGSQNSAGDVTPTLSMPFQDPAAPLRRAPGWALTERRQARPSGVASSRIGVRTGGPSSSTPRR